MKVKSGKTLPPVTTLQDLYNGFGPVDSVWEVAKPIGYLLEGKEEYVVRTRVGSEYMLTFFSDEGPSTFKCENLAEDVLLTQVRLLINPVITFEEE